MIETANVVNSSLTAATGTQLQQIESSTN